MSPALIWTILHFLAGVFQTAAGDGDDELHLKTHEILDSILNTSRYDTNKWPTFGNGPTVITVNLHVNSFGSINAANMEYEVDVFVRQQWIDSRLKYEIIPNVEALYYYRPEVLTRLWRPDLYFQNVKQAYMHLVTKPNHVMRIHPNGSVLYSLRLNLDLSCPMELEYFPFDEQICHINMSSFAFPRDVLRFRWMEKRSVTLNPDMELPQFRLIGIETTESNWTSQETGVFSKLTVTFLLARQNQYHLTQTYIPTVLIVIISWVSFWLDPNAIPGRVTLGVTTLLTITTLASGVRTQLPPVAYLKAIDVWIGVCTVYVFGALFEFTLVNFLSRQKMGPKGAPFSQRMKQLFFSQNTVSPVTSSNEPVKTHIEMAKRVDRYCRIFFPVTFLVFNAIYWLYYLSVADILKPEPSSLMY